MRDISKRKITTISDDGFIVTKTGYNLLDERSKAKELSHTAIFALLIVVACMVVDYYNFSDLFSGFSYAREAKQKCLIAGMLLSFDVAPYLLGIELKRYYQGYKVPKAFLIGLLTIFMIGLIANFVLRISLANSPTDYASGGASFSDRESVGLTEEGGPDMLYMTLFTAVIPLLTTGVSFFASWVSTNPLKKDYLAALKEKYMLEDDILRYEQALKECEYENGTLREKLIKADDERYLSKQREIQDKADEWKCYVRDQIKIHVGDPAAISELSVTEQQDGIVPSEHVESYRIA